MEKIHIRNIFRVFIPLDRNLGSGTAQTKTEPFGLEYSQNESRFDFTLRLVCTDEYGNIKHEPKDCFTWAKRNPIIYQQKSNDDAPNGLYIRLKINQGVFDFRKTKDRLFQVVVELTENGAVSRSGTSVIWELFPKKRQTEIEEGDNEAVVPIYWLGEDGYLMDDQQHVSPIDSSHSVQESVFEDNALMVVSNASNSNHQYALTLHNPDTAMALHDSSEYYSPHDNYMVLYNGNAEVVGNFRALNFYKASDINIKEDIRLLEEDRDCRAALLRINGVEYKFKPGVSHATNKRFTGYIAQQVETVVPEAVQLIDGILHVDYEALIPYLSESVKQNFRDLQNVTAEVQSLKKVLDGLYDQFTGFKKTKQSEDNKMKHNRRNKVIGWLVGIFTVSAIIALTITWVFFSEVNHVKITPLSDTLTPPEFERDILVQLYISLTHDMKPLSPWNLAEPHCSWHGIKCNATSGRVISIAMSSFGTFQGFNGTSIPDDIGKFTELQDLDLSLNFMTGTIPESIKNLTNLKFLALAQNSLTGTVPDLRGLTKLSLLILNNNNLRGPLDMIMQLPSLSTLYFYGNYVPGDLPRNISSSLKEILMASCGLNGTIPDSWTTSNLESIDLSFNSLHGSVPCLGQKLVQLNLQNNKLDGTFCGSSLRSISGLTLSNNNMTGTFDLPNVNITTVRYIAIEHNSFVTLLPSTWNMSVTLAPTAHCSAFYNAFKCPIPEWTLTKCSATCT